MALPNDTPTYKIIRTAKIVAIDSAYLEDIQPHKGETVGRNYWALTDGGHRLPITLETAATLYEVISMANASDERFFNRGG